MERSQLRSAFNGFPRQLSQALLLDRVEGLETVCCGRNRALTRCSRWSYSLESALVKQCAKYYLWILSRDHTSSGAQNSTGFLSHDLRLLKYLAQTTCTDFRYGRREEQREIATTSISTKSTFAKWGWEEQEEEEELHARLAAGSNSLQVLSTRQSRVFPAAQRQL